jgi:glycerol kinase
MEKYILALDQGTSSSRAILFNKKGQVVGIQQKEFKQHYPKTGWVEQNPEEIWQSQLEVATKVLKESGIGAEQIDSIGITNQRETTVVWDKNSGNAIYNAIVWQDKRTSSFCEEIKEDNIAGNLMNATGLVIDSYFSATKLHWILNNVTGAKEKAQKGELLFGTIDTWLIWKLTKGACHATDYTNASRTMLFNIHSLEWDKQLLAYFDIPETMMPTVHESSNVVAKTHPDWFSGQSIPIAGVAGDQQAALFGQAGFEKGMAKNTYGTGCFILTHTGGEYVNSKHGLISTLTCDTQKGKPRYALEGSVFIAGAAIKWLRDSLKIIDSAASTQAMAESIDSTYGVYVVPAFTGLGAPYWNMYTQGTILGLTLGTGDKHIVRATLEALAYQSKDVIRAMEQDAGISIHSLNVDGGACANNYLMQFQSDILNTEVIRPANIESTALGAAFLAGLATGFWKDLSELENIRAVDSTFKPTMSDVDRKKLYSGWKKAVKVAMQWEGE